jgi:hypothetical protein
MTDTTETGTAELAELRRQVDSLRSQLTIARESASLRVFTGI